MEIARIAHAGRCRACATPFAAQTHGQGTIKTTLDFLPDVEVTCEACQGLRFQDYIVAIKYKDYDLNQILNMDETLNK